MKNKKVFVGLTVSLAATVLLGCGKEDEELNNSEVISVPNIDIASFVTTTSNSDLAAVTTTSKQNVTSITTTAATSAVTTVTTSPETTIITTTKPMKEYSVSENSIAWLNYIGMISEEILKSENNKMYLEEVDGILKNYNPEKIDYETQDFINRFLVFIDNYRISDLKRNRLKYFYEREQAVLIKNVLKEFSRNNGDIPITGSSVNPAVITMQAIIMAADKALGYMANKYELDMEYLQSGWNLDDEEAKIVRDLQKDIFNYTVNITRKYNLTQDDTLSSDAIKKFVECKQWDNVDRQIQFLENKDSEKIYRNFGCYWLSLSEYYFKNEQYKECLDSFKQYEELNNCMFRKDYDLSRTLPMVIVAAQKVQGKEEYISSAKKYLEVMLANRDDNDWEIAYFAAEIYCDLYNKTYDKAYLRQSYEILKNSINDLINVQMTINSTYANQVDTISTEGVTKEDKKKIEAYNKSLVEKRKHELPEIYEPLSLNCDFLFSIADKLDLSQEEKKRLDGMLSDVFINKAVQEIYSFDTVELSNNVIFDKDTLKIPVSLISDSSVIEVTVTNGDEQKVVKNYQIDQIIRKGKNASDYIAVYKSDKLDGYEWNYNSKIKVKITDRSYYKPVSLEYNFKVSKYKKHMLEDTVEFAIVT